MTCDHVLSLIDADSLAHEPAPTIEAARAHARECRTCGPALEAAAALTHGLISLPHPSVPSDMTTIVMARIARLEAIEEPATAGAQAVRRAARMKDALSWATAVAGLAAGLILVLFTPAGQTTLEFAARLQLSTPALVNATAMTATDKLIMGAGLLLFGAALFIPVSGRGLVGRS